MTKRTTTGALLVIGALVAAACGDGVLPSGPDFEAQFAHKPGQGSTVDVCHKGRTISVNSNALRGHERHGDKPGSCGGGGDASISLVKVTIISAIPFVSVDFTSTNCSSGAGDFVAYRLVNQGGSVVDEEDFAGDGPHNLSAMDGDDPFIVQADCDGNGSFETPSASFP